MIKRQRKLQRLSHYNYSQPGWYFVTICTKYMVHWFGKIENQTMYLNELGNIVNNYWLNIPKHFDDIILDTYVIMPNHIHGIIKISKTHNYTLVGNRHACSQISNKRQYQYLPVVIESFKSATAKNIRNINSEFKWHKSYHDRIIRNTQELQRIRQYVKNNPKNWNNQKYT